MFLVLKAIIALIQTTQYPLFALLILILVSMLKRAVTLVQQVFTLLLVLTLVFQHLQDSSVMEVQLVQT